MPCATLWKEYKNPMRVEQFAVQHLSGESEIPYVAGVLVAPSLSVTETAFLDFAGEMCSLSQRLTT